MNGNKTTHNLRKLIHLLFSLLLFSATYYVERWCFWTFLFVCFLTQSLWEFLRLKRKDLLPEFLKFKSLLKDRETKGLTDAWYYILGMLIASLLLWDSWLRALILILGVSDPLAYYTGKALKGPKILGQKSLYGSLSFFASTILILYTVGISKTLGMVNTLLFALILTFSEVFFERDNLSIPIAYTLWATLS